MVSQGEILAVLESSGNYMDIIYLDSTLSKDRDIDLSVEDLLNYYPTDLNLGGSIQTVYTNYIESYLSHIQSDFSEA